ncbi:MAG: hypothetical protein JKY65_22360, partial [Planctomycetes bacterium]|nr:hypothetical protein [Planctomycetota bacterium]
TALAPPQPLALSQADYQAVLVGDHARVQARFVFTGLARCGYVQLALLRPSEVAIQSASLNGEGVALSPLDEWIGLSLGAEEAHGEQVVEVSFLIALTGEDPLAQGFSFSTPRSPVTRLSVRGLRRDVLPTCTPGFGLSEQEVEGERAVEVSLPPTDRIRFGWRPETERVEVSRRPALLGGAVHTKISVGERSLELRARVEIQVSGGPLAGVQLVLPPGFLLHQTTGDIVRDARPARDEDGEHLRVRFTHDLLGQAVFEVRGEVPTDPDLENVEAPVLALPAGHRVRGTVAIEAGPRVEIELASLEGATRVDPSELSWRPGASLPGAQTLLAFKFVRACPTLGLTLRRHKDAPVLVATCDHAHLRALFLAEGKLFVKAHLALRNNARTHLELGLPEGAELWSAYCGGNPVRPSARKEGSGALIPLLQGRDAPFEVELAYLLRLPALEDHGQVSLPLPALDLPQTHVSLALFLPERFRHFNFEGGLSRVDAFSRGFHPPDPVSEIGPSSNLAQQAIAMPRARPGAAAGLGGEGQLPIRLPALERGLEHRFEKSLVVEPPEALAWEYKRRRRRL